MNLKITLVALALSSALTAITLDASACSTVIVGKDVSATGHILIGHNEDNGGRILTSQYHPWGERCPEWLGRDLGAPAVRAET